ncbi:MAG: hypothetical protein H5U14_01885, partial [Roseovarius sp.]|nr:hypothetical protein [Roseovarius sp.]
AAGDKAVAALTARAVAAGIAVLVLSPQGGDFNDDLQATGLDALRAALRGGRRNSDQLLRWIA